MFKSLPSTQPLLWIDFYQFGQKILTILRKLNWKSKSREVIFLGFLNKWRLNHQHLIHQNSNAPAIYFIIIVISLCNFRTNIIQCSTKSSSLLICLSGPSEISNFQMISKADNILRLQIPMHYTISMKILDSTGDLKQKFRCFFLIERPCSQNLFVEIVISILHHEKNFIFSYVVSIGWKNMWMLTIQMNFHLLNQELQLNLLFFEAFQCDNNIIYIRNSENNFSCLAFTQSFQHFQLILRLLSIFQLCYFFQCFIYILQFIIDIYLFLEMLPIQFYWCFIFSHFAANIINISDAIKITMKSIFCCCSTCLTFIKCR